MTENVRVHNFYIYNIHPCIRNTQSCSYYALFFNSWFFICVSFVTFRKYLRFIQNTTTVDSCNKNTTTCSTHVCFRESRDTHNHAFGKPVLEYTDTGWTHATSTWSVTLGRIKRVASPSDYSCPTLVTYYFDNRTSWFRL